MESVLLFKTQLCKQWVLFAVALSLVFLWYFYGFLWFFLWSFKHGFAMCFAIVLLSSRYSFAMVYLLLYGVSNFFA